MLHIALWGILAVVMGISALIGFGLLGLIVWCTGAVAHDIVVGSDGEIWCPVQKRQYHVRGTSRGSLEGISFSALKTCECWGPGHIQCSKSCLVERAESFAV